MISYIKGKVTYKAAGYVIIENNDIGYHINVPATSKAYIIDQSEKITMYTEMIVREDDISLYGFTDAVSLELFNRLITVSGVGAKAALSILSSLTTDEIRKSIVFNDPGMLTRAQGIGKKTAQRIVLELKDKLEGLNTESIFAIDDAWLSTAAASDEGSQMNSINEAVEALVSLGYSKTEAVEAVASTGLTDASTEEYVKAALRKLSIL